MATEPKTKLVLIDIPPEILTHILLLLPPPSVLACARVNRYLQDLISDSVEVQYHIHRNTAGQLDNPYSELPICDRLAELLVKERRWEELHINFERTIDVPFPTSGIYDLTGGIYLLGSASRKVLHYIYLPSGLDEELEWKELHSPHAIIDMGLCVYEHDLIAVITTQPHIAESTAPSTLPTSHDIHLYLSQVSTGEPHPEAKQPVISVMNTRWDRPAVGIEIVGDNLVLILAYYDNPHKPDDQVFVYEWKTSKMKMKLSAPYHSYSGLLFLTEDIILLPNANNGTLEYWRIPQTPSDPIPLQPFFVLSLPKIGARKSIGHISCRAEPNPTTSFLYTSKPFHTDPHHAIAIFNINIRSGNLHPALNIHFSSSFVFFTHRSALIACLDRFSSFISDNTEPQHIPYNEWGPSICRWFAAEAFPTRWITTTAGQRCVIIPDMGVETDKAPIILLNFNQNDVYKVLDREKRDKEERIAAETVEREAKNKEASRPQHASTVQGPQMGDATISNGGTSVHVEQKNTEGDSGQGMEHSADEYTDDEEDIETYSDTSDTSDEMHALSDSPVGFDETPRDQTQRSRPRARAITRAGDAVDDSQHCFENMVYSSLPYTVCSSSNKYSFHGVLLDEERVLGLRTNILQRVTTVHLFHCG